MPIARIIQAGYVPEVSLITSGLSLDEYVANECAVLWLPDNPEIEGRSPMFPIGPFPDLVDNIRVAYDNLNEIRIFRATPDYYPLLIRNFDIRFGNQGLPVVTGLRIRNKPREIVIRCHCGVPVLRVPRIRGNVWYYTADCPVCHSLYQILFSRIGLNSTSEVGGFLNEPPGRTELVLNLYRAQDPRDIEHGNYFLHRGSLVDRPSVRLATLRIRTDFPDGFPKHGNPKRLLRVRSLSEAFGRIDEDSSLVVCQEVFGNMSESESADMCDVWGFDPDEEDDIKRRNDRESTEGRYRYRGGVIPSPSSEWFRTESSTSTELIPESDRVRVHLNDLDHRFMNNLSRRFRATPEPPFPGPVEDDAAELAAILEEANTQVEVEKIRVISSSDDTKPVARRKPRAVRRVITISKP